LNNLGKFLSEVGRRQEALAPTEEAVRIYRELVKTNPAYLPNVATALNNLGVSLSELGRRQEALAPTEEALQIRRELAKTNPAFLPDLASSLNNLGIRLSELGRRQEALAPSEEALRIYRELAKTNPAFLPDLASSLNNLGIRLSELGRRQEALAPTEEALRIYRELAKTNPAFLNDLAKALNNLGNRFSKLNRRQEALVPTEEAVRIFRDLAKINPAFQGELATALTSLGVINSELGRRQEALAATEEAVKIFRELAKTNPAFLPDLARSTTNLAVGHLQLANPGPALQPLREAVTSDAFYLQSQLPLLPEGRRQALVGAFGARWQIPFSLAQQGEAGASLALFTRLNRQGLQQDIARRQALLARATGAPSQLVDRLMVLKAELANPSLPVDRYQQALQESDRLQGELFRQQPALQPRLVQPEQVAQRLPADGVLVEFQRYQSLNASANAFDPSAKAFDPPRYLALVLTPKGAIHAVPLGEASELEPLIQKALAKVAEVPERSDVSAEQAQQALAEVRRRLLDPLLPYGGAAKRWIISPDGEIHRVPLAALPASDGALNGPTLGETRQLQVITTGRDLLDDAPAPPSASPALVMADPAYDARLGQSAPGATPPSTRPQTRSGDDQAKRWAPLTNFKPEGEKVAGLLGTSLISGVQATTTRLQQAQGPRIVHIATHGFFLPDRKEDLDPKGPFQGFTTLEMPLLEREDPQLRSGIVLAGANHPEASAEDDGRLTALEATALNLSGTQLVTLSACSTGLGSQATGEGVYGLQRSLRVAGARATLLSLWEVDDAATKAFMVDYYTLLKQGMGRAEALRLVQRKLRDHARYSHPHYWAAWQLSGDSGAVPGDPSAGRGQP
ncbi:MAG: CHAT domain-containing tetratricopeptide repeat protein, partial [Cyanobium sp.]